jgi:hypothetical protein
VRVAGAAEAHNGFKIRNKRRRRGRGRSIQCGMWCGRVVPLVPCTVPVLVPTVEYLYLFYKKYDDDIDNTLVKL